MSQFRVLLLGPFVLLRDGVPVDTAHWQRRVETLFKLLAVAPERRRLRDELIEILWPHTSAETGAANLRLLTHRLRSTLTEGTPGNGPAPVLAERGWVFLNPAHDWELDLDQLVAAVAAAGHDPQKLEAAAELYRGEPLLEDRYDDWAVPARESAQRAWRELCLRLGAIYLRDSHAERAVSWFERSLQTDPLDEEALRGLLRALSGEGRRSDALRLYAAFEQRLRAEMNASPAPETVALAERIRTGEGAPDPRRPQRAVAPSSARQAPLSQNRPSRRLAIVLALLPLLAASVIVAVLIARNANGNSASGPPTVPGEINPNGSGPGQFNGPTGMGIDRQGNIYVADRSNGRIQTFSPLGAWIASWGTPGSGPLQFIDPSDVAVDFAGTIYVADGGNRRIEQISPSGQPLDDFPYIASSVAVDRAGNIYATDYGHDRVRKIDRNGTVLAIWSGAPYGFQHPAGIAVDSRGNIYVANAGNDRIEKLSPGGTVLTSWGGPGSRPGRLNNPQDLAVDSASNVYVADTNNSRIQVFSADGRFERQVGALGDAPGHFRKPSGVAVDAAGNVYVSDYYHDRVQKLSPAGKPLWETNGRYALTFH
ncbi:MAG TPA: BTAD domain-containing putative transcriptional regulator [Chloroflexota bacterium]